jgi:hypothetical protein
MCGDSSPLAPFVDTVEDIGGTIGDLGNQVDQAVNDNVPGGWALPAAVALAVATGYVDPSLFGAEVGAELGGEGAVGAESAGIGDLGLSGTEASDLTYFDTPTDTSYLNDFAPTDTGTAQLGTGTALAEGATTNPLSPYYGVSADANNPLLTSAGYGSSELGGTGSIIGSGTGLGVSTLPEVSAATGFGGLTAADFPSYDVSNAGNGVNAKNIADALRLANTAKNLLSSQNRTMQSFNTLNNQNQNQNLLNAQGTGLPTEYRAKNPFDFGQQQPVQDTLASLLRNNYGG